MKTAGEAKEGTVRTMVLALAREPLIRDFVTRGPGRALARRFVAGETLEDGLAAARTLGQTGGRVSLDYLGEAVTDLAEAAAAAEIYGRTLDHLPVDDLSITLSLKPSQFGVDLSPSKALTLLEGTAARAAGLGIGIRLDMEDSSRTDVTLALWRALHRRFENVGIVLQAALYRTPRDFEEVLAEGGSVRLCKGAYAESASIAYPQKSDVDAAYGRLLEQLLTYAATRPPVTGGQLPIAAIATHDERQVQRALALIHGLDLAPGQYEFQMLYGVRRDLQGSLIASGYPLRVYTPWGPSWYPYLTRRLAERPSNVAFLVTALVSEAWSGGKIAPRSPRGKSVIRR